MSAHFGYLLNCYLLGNQDISSDTEHKHYSLTLIIRIKDHE